ncbi:MAG: hypothetical protein AB1566_01345 [Chloroflexota bacterium]
MSSQTVVVPFILRFTREALEESWGQPQAAWRGLIRHVQGDQEQHFTRFADAVDFMKRFIDLQDAPIEDS